MGLGCSQCQEEKQMFLSDRIDSYDKESHKGSNKIVQNHNNQEIDYKPKMEYQFSPKKQYSADTYPEYTITIQDECIFDFSEDFFSSNNVQTLQNELMIQDSMIQRSQSCSRISIFSSIKQACSEQNEYLNDSWKASKKENFLRSTKKRKTDRDTKIIDQGLNYRYESSRLIRAKQKKQSQAILHQHYDYQFCYNSQDFLKEKKSYSVRVISILKKPHERKFRSNTPTKKRVRFSFDSSQFYF